MTTITVPLSEESLQRLKERAEEARVSPDELVRASVEEWLSRPNDEFLRAANYVLQKNADLYRRLA